MIIVLLGASGSGKSTIENELSTKYGYEKIISYTTRKQRNGEVNGKDYHFVVNPDTFKERIKSDIFAEYEEYSQGRFYGTLKSDYCTKNNSNKVVVLTPNGLRQLKRSLPEEKIASVLVEANLGTRIKRYIDRCGVDKFNFDDKNEIAARVERDFGMFAGIQNEVDMIVENNEGNNVNAIAELIHKSLEDYFDAPLLWEM